MLKIKNKERIIGKHLYTKSYNRIWTIEGICELEKEGVSFYQISIRRKLGIFANEDIDIVIQREVGVDVMGYIIRLKHSKSPFHVSITKQELGDIENLIKRMITLLELEQY